MPDSLDLDAIEARANAATPGPWTVLRSSDHPGERHIEAGIGAGVYVALDMSADDAALISACRTDIPALVARVRELETQSACCVVNAMTVGLLEAERDERTRQHAARGAEAVAVIDALRVELANERGEGEGPSEGWEWASYPGRWGNPNGWSLIERGLSHAAVGRNADGTGWDWYAMVPSALRGGVSGSAPTAREAMRQADLARGAK